MYVTQSTILAEWFINYELQLAMGMASCVPLLGSFLGGAVVPSAYNATGGFGLCMLIGFLVCIQSLLCVIGCVILDYKMEKADAIWLAQYREQKEMEASQYSEVGEDGQKGEDGVEFVKERNTVFKQGEDIQDVNENQFNCQDIKDFEAPFWYTCLSCMLRYIAIVNSIVIAGAML